MKRKYHVTVYTWGDQVLYRKIREINYLTGLYKE